MLEPEAHDETAQLLREMGYDPATMTPGEVRAALDEGIAYHELMLACFEAFERELERW